MITHDVFKDAGWYPVTEPIVVVGAGGIGSWLSLYLSRISTGDIIIFDHDEIEQHNLGGQLFATEDVGLTKVQSLQNTAKRYSGKDIIAFADKFTEEDGLTAPIMFSAVDNMKARKIIFERWKAQEDKEIFIDGRLEAETYQVYVVTPDKCDEYEKTLFEDAEVETLNCTYKQTSQIAGRIAVEMVGVLTNYLTNKRKGIKLTKVPFRIEWIQMLMRYECV